MDYISAAQAAEKWGITVKRVQVLCKENRIHGVERIGREWLIPMNAEKPADARIKSGEYIGFSKKYRGKKDNNEINEGYKVGESDKSFDY
ncbi:DNA-binding protein [Ruminiclostridium herbifermentans]|uniref:DNA-binding protein n=1 Tax=Ruminiclostridium herbifermentans TaxID=2488810 RepID=UPI001FD51E78|nr:DNA-binding protein [Ruminiclostridium herbifermentans]